MLKHKFVEFIPDKLEERVLYISIEYKTILHKCCCGCGNEVVTPLTPTDWKMIFDGETISLYPSIGNWNFNCQSHYWIKRNRIEWAPQWSKKRIQEGRIADINNKQSYFNDVANQPELGAALVELTKHGNGVVYKVKRFLSGFFK